MKNKIKISILSLVTLAVSCGPKNIVSKDRHMFEEIDETFVPLLEKFGCSYPDSFTMGLAYLPEGTPEGGQQAAYCASFKDGTHEVVVDIVKWKFANLDERKAMIYHELGHCLLNLGHDDKIDESGHPESLMNSFTLKGSDASYFRDHEQEYLDQLKGHTNC